MSNNFLKISAALVSIAVFVVSPQIAKASTAEEIEKIAEKITVLIPSEEEGANGKITANGSGSIIAKEGRVYTVLTASHVICKDARDACKFYYDQLKIITWDGKKYPLDYNSIKKLPGVDLALVQFQSDQNYQLATLANYQVADEKIEKVPVPIGFSLAIPITTFLKLAPQSGIQGQINVENSPPNTLSLQEIGDELYKAFEFPHKNDTNPLNWLNQGNTMWRLGQLALAYAAYEKALQLDAQLYQAWYGKGLVLTYWKRSQEALAAYEQALKINPKSDTAKKLRDKLQESLGGGNTPSLTPSQPTTAPTVEPSPEPSNPRRLW
jgi:tetratricopeptide (TPR) repeat protein